MFEGQRKTERERKRERERENYAKTQVPSGPSVRNFSLSPFCVRNKFLCFKEILLS